MRNLFTAIDVTTRNADPGQMIGAQLCVMRVFQNRVREHCVGRSAFLKLMKTFAITPTVVLAFADDIDFLPFVLPHIAAIEQPGLMIETEAPRVSKPPGINFRRK